MSSLFDHKMSPSELLLDLSKHSLSPGPTSRIQNGTSVNIQQELKYLLKRLKLKGWKVVMYVYNCICLKLTQTHRTILVIPNHFHMKYCPITSW